MARQTMPQVARNRGPIARVLAKILPAEGLVLEVGCGSGEHARHFARAFPGLTWQPTDFTPEALESTGEWAEQAALPNLRPPLCLDVREQPWPVRTADALVCINTIHYAPPEVTPALLQGAASALPHDAPLYLYGPYNVGGSYTSESNERFDGWLKRQNPTFGIRHLEQVVDAAADAGFTLERTVEMPANNLSVIFRREPAAL